MSSRIQQKTVEKVEEKKEEKKVEKKVTRDSGYNCIYCNGKNHVAIDCILKKKEEKKEKVK